MTPYQHNINLIDAPCLFSKNNVILTLHELLGALLDDVALWRGAYSKRKEFAPL